MNKGQRILTTLIFFFEWKRVRKRSQKEIIFYFDGSDFSQLAVQPYESIRNLYEDPQVVRDIQSTLGDLFLYSFERHGQAEEYEFEELEEIDQCPQIARHSDLNAQERKKGDRSVYPQSSSANHISIFFKARQDS